MNRESLASELIAEQQTRARRWRTAFIISVGLWLLTVAAMLYYSL